VHRYIVHQKKTEETIHSQYKYTFLQSGPHMMNFKHLQLYHQETTFDREIKQRIRQWNDNKDCTRSAVPYVIL